MIHKSKLKAEAKIEKLTKRKSNDYVQNLYQVVESKVPADVLKRRNKKADWELGWQPEYDFVNISHDGTIGEFLEIQGLVISLPAKKNIYSRSKEVSEQYWEVEPCPDDKLMAKIKNTQQLQYIAEDKRETWEKYIDQEWDRREEGMWFMNEGDPTYITGSHYFYLRWANIDVGLPDFRMANMIFWYFWEACKVDQRAYGMCYLKNRRSGFSYMASSETVNQATQTAESQYGMLSKTGADSASMFQIKVVKIANNLPFFFMPIRSGESKPKSELVFAVPSTKLTKRRMDNLTFDEDDEIDVGLNTKINWKTTANNSYDGEKLKLLVHDESGKWEKPNNIINNWNVTRTCLILGSQVVGKCIMGSTCNKQKGGGAEFKELYESSDLRKTGRNDNGETPSGLYSLFIPMEWNVEGKIDIYGKPVFHTPEKPRKAWNRAKGGGATIWCTQGSIEWWDNKTNGLKKYPAQQNEHIRQFPRTENHAFRDEIHGAIFNIAKINQQIDHNDALDITRKMVTEGVFQWAGGIPDTTVEFAPRKSGRFKVGWFPPSRMQNIIDVTDGNKRPGNPDLGAFGCDPYDIDGVNYGVGSNGALHGITTTNIEQDVPSNQFFLEYIARPSTSYIFFEDILMACIFYGMPILIENNKPGILRHFKNRGYTQYTMLRPDKRLHELKTSDLSLRGIPNNSEDVLQLHAGMVESYVERYIGEDEDGEYNFMPFNRTLNDWLRFEPRNRTEYDATISSGLAIMATRKSQILPPMEIKNRVIHVPMGKYAQDGNFSKLL